MKDFNASALCCPYRRWLYELHQVPVSQISPDPAPDFCVHCETHPAVLIGTGKAPVVFGPDKVKLGKGYRLRLKLDGQQATATLTETQDTDPQVIEATLAGSPKDPVGITDFGTPVTFATFFIRSQEYSLSCLACARQCLHGILGRTFDSNDNNHISGCNLGCLCHCLRHLPLVYGGTMGCSAHVMV